MKEKYRKPVGNNNRKTKKRIASISKNKINT